MTTRVLFWLVMVGLWLLMVMSMMGCGGIATPVTADLSQVGEGLARIEGDAVDARGHVERAKPHADDMGKTELAGAEFSLDDLLNELADTTVAYDAAVSQAGKLAGNYADKSRELEEERDHWLGYKTRRLFFWIVLIGSLGWLGLGLAGMFLKGFGVGWVFTAGTQLLRLLPAANLFSAGAAKITRARDTARAEGVVGAALDAGIKARDNAVYDVLEAYAARVVYDAKRNAEQGGEK